MTADRLALENRVAFLRVFATLGVRGGYTVNIADWLIAQHGRGLTPLHFTLHVGHA